MNSSLTNSILLNNDIKSYLKFFQEIDGRPIRQKSWDPEKTFIPVQIDATIGCFYGYFNDSTDLVMGHTFQFISNIRDWEIL